MSEKAPESSVDIVYLLISVLYIPITFTFLLNPTRFKLYYKNVSWQFRPMKLAQILR